MYEHRKQKLAPMSVFYQRVLKNILLAVLVLFICLMIGHLGLSFYGKYTLAGFTTQRFHDIEWDGTCGRNKDCWRQIVLFFLCLVQWRRVYNQYRHHTGAGYAPDVSPVAYCR